MQRTPSSRLARNQGKKIARQSITMIIFSIGVVILFFFVLMPRLIDLFFNFLGTGDLSFNNDDEIAPQIPVVLQLPEATKESKLKVEGYADAESQVIFVQNGEKKDEVKVDDKGSFSYELTLSEGENLIGLYSRDEAKNESVVKEFKINLDTEAPGLELENLTDNQQIILKANQNYEIKGKTEPHAKLSINDRSVYVDSEGNFRTNYYLSEGDNQLKFIVEDQAGNKIEREVRVNFRY